jgi:arginyl-tRNA synthetase
MSTCRSDSLTLVTSALLSSAILDVIRSLVAEGSLVVPDGIDPQVRRSHTYGDHSSPVALRLAKASGRPAKDIAALIASRLERMPGIDKVDVTGPGFLSILSNDSVAPAYEYEWDEAPTPIGNASWQDRPRTFENPGFRVRYAYSRAACTDRYAKDLGIEAAPGPLTDPKELRLVRLLDDLPSRVPTKPTNHEHSKPSKPTESLETVLGSVADAYHDVHEHCPALPKGDEPALPAHAARLMLARAVRDALGHGLRLLGEIPKERI